MTNTPILVVGGRTGRGHGGGLSVRVLPRFTYLASALRHRRAHSRARLRLEGPDGHATIIESDGPAALMIRRADRRCRRLAVDMMEETPRAVLREVDSSHVITKLEPS